MRLAAEGPERPLIVLVGLDGGVDGTDEADEVRSKAAERAAAAIQAAVDDGVTVDSVFADSLLASDGGPAPAADQLRLR